MKFFVLCAFLLVCLVQSIHGGEDAPVLGGLVEVPVDDPEVVRLSQVGLKKLNEGLAAESRKLVEVVKAYRQVVQGVMTHLTLKVSEGDVHKECKVKVWEKPMSDVPEVTHAECN